jgi:O-antigen/teichoic acid export membrane protein
MLAVGMMLILIRSMTQTDYAAYIVFSNVALLFVSLLGSGINNALVRFSAEYFFSTGTRPYLLYTLSLGLQIVIFLILFVCTLAFPTQAVTLLLGKPEFTHLLPVSMLFGLGNLLLFSGQSILQAEEKFGLHVGTLWLKQGLMFITILGLWISQTLDFRWVAWGLTIAQLIIGIGVVFFSIAGISSINWTEQIEREKSFIRYFLSASGWLIGYFIAVAGFSRIDVLILSRYVSEPELANYGVAFQYYALALLVLGSVSAVLRPKFSHPEMQEPAQQRQFLIKWLRYTAWVIILILLFIILGKPAYVFINGNQYEQSFGILAVLSIGVWLSLALSPLVNILMSRKQFRFLFFLGVSAFFGSLIAFFICVQLWGGIGAAIAVIVIHNIFLQIPILWRILHG